MEKSTRFNILYFLLAALGIFVIHDYVERAKNVAAVPYSQFQTWLKEGKVKHVVISARDIEGELKAPEKGTTRFIANRVEPTLAEDLQKQNVSYEGRVDNTLLPAILSWLVPVAVFFGVWFFVLRRLASKIGGPGGGVMSIGKSKAKVYVETDVKTTFKDVAGVDEAKGELQETVAFLKDPKSYGRLGARMPKGVLLVGPPGTGKTLLARAVAGESGVPFFSISGSEFVEMFVGVGAARVRDLFEQARGKAPCIIFIDELDALGRARNGYPGIGGHDEKEQTLNQLLVELDGFDATSGIVLIAATNRPEILDPALLRAGRFDRQILVGRPDKLSRLEIIRVHAKKIKLAKELVLEEIAAMTAGFTGADLANLVNEAALVATRRSAVDVTRPDFEAALERIIAGLEKKNRVLSEPERRIVAYHEMGHALVAASLPMTDPVQKISIIPRGIGALGYTLQRPTEDRYLMTKGELDNRMCVLLGGRAAELIIFGHLSTGASDDLAKATDIARSMATRYAMVPELGNVAFDGEQNSFLSGPAAPPPRRLYSDETAHQIDIAIQHIVQSAFTRARAILERNRATLESGAVTLLEKETLAESDIQAIFATVVKDSEELVRAAE